MSSIRFRPDQNLTVAEGIAPKDAGGYVSGEDNSLATPGAAPMQSLKIEPVEKSVTAEATLRETLAARILRGIDYNSIPAEDGFDAAASLGEKSSAYNVAELKFLGDSRSTTELTQRMGQVVETRQHHADMSANPMTMMATSLFDVDAVIGIGFGALTSATRVARATMALTANSVALGMASEGGTVTPLEVIATSLGAALAAVPRTRVAITAADDVADVAPAAARNTKATETAEDLATTDTQIKIPPKSIPDPDYVPPKPDVQIRTPYVEVGRGNRATLTTDTANLTAAVLAHGDDLPAGVRILGQALHDSLKLDAGSPVVLRRATASSRSSVRLNADGTITGNNYVKIGIGDTLTDTVKGMTAYEKSIALHEAAHAKTVRTFAAFRAGTLPDGPAKQAVTRIEAIRQEAAAAYKPSATVSKNAKYNVNYGLQSNDEFISQLFNSSDFRAHLQSIPSSTGGNLFTDLVRRVVQAFTGKTPTGTLFDETVGEFEKMLQFKSNLKSPLEGAPRVPVMQSEALLGAPDITTLGRRAAEVINPNMALYDKIKTLGGTSAAKLADELVVDGAGTFSQSAVHYGRTAELAGNLGMAIVDRAFVEAMASKGWGTLSRMRNPAKYLADRKQFSEEVYGKLSENHKAYREGAEITPHADPAVEKAVQAFADSKWANDALDRLKSAGVRGAEKVDESPYYLPRRHSGDTMSKYLRDNPKVKRSDVEDMYASQFHRIFAEQGMEEATAKKLGAQMVRNMEQRAAGVQGFRQQVTGMSDDDIEFAMRNAGIEEDQIASFLRTSQAAGADAGTIKNLKRRQDFDMTADFETASGQFINPQMFVAKDVMSLMEGYTRNTSGRIGLAKVGYADTKAIAAAVDDAIAGATDARVAKQTLDDTVNKILGYPTGENVPDIFRSFTILSGATALANSGIYQLADVTLMMKQFGMGKVLKAMSETSFTRDALKLAQDPMYGSRLRDIIEARNVMSGRYRSVMTHLDDNTDIGSMGFAHQMVQQMGQSTRFINGMEYVRRAQSKITAGLIGDTFDAAIKGDAKAAEAIRRFGVNSDMLQKARAAMNQSEDLREWPSSIRMDMETAAHNMADTLVLDNRLGEIPGWMQFSALGKVILPYMTFVAGTWNKILRRTIRQEGSTGVAMMLAYQLPLTTLVSTAVLAGNDKPITPATLAANALTQAPLMSWLGYAVNMATQGPSNSIAALGIITKAYAATAGIISGNPDPSQIIKATPFVGLIPGVRIAAQAWNDKD